DAFGHRGAAGRSGRPGAGFALVQRRRGDGVPRGPDRPGRRVGAHRGAPGRARRAAHPALPAPVGPRRAGELPRRPHGGGRDAGSGGGARSGGGGRPRPPPAGVDRPPARTPDRHRLPRGPRGGAGAGAAPPHPRPGRGRGNLRIAALHRTGPGGAGAAQRRVPRPAARILGVAARTSLHLGRHGGDPREFGAGAAGL
ncbi:MAG: Uncharacterized Nudix hydrolase NudL, partial [uncultured Acetobacteraceae bacterium]